ncbi:uncharacterized protein LOC122298813 [Carya illinoinensis]|uniref:uncharacterized protein LOC122298813 n=1 Tax=Carya illinoinensis TaxID=32201 RepID=UPI001C726B07|nr:uncharacterized protein LOC122298813 [Carya illinoinensis]
MAFKEDIEVRDDRSQQHAEVNEPLELVTLYADCPEATTRIGTQFLPADREALKQLLIEHRDIFAWNHEEMPGIDYGVIEHCLGVDPAHKEAHYPEWLSDVFMVKKAKGKWRMCVDFTDLNKACPKDSFPLPRIDIIVDATAGHHMLSFMDVYSGYNQIQMHIADKEKTSFVTDRGLYCYQVMPFRLKNAGATYQRLVLRNVHPWNEQCDEVIKKLKQYLASPPLLKRPEKGDVLYAYLAVSQHAVSAVLVKEEEAAQHPVYYAPLAKVLRKPDSTGRLIGWLIELSEFDVEYEPRKAIKGQALADFVVESSGFSQEETMEPSGKPWVLFIDVSSCREGGGLGIHLLSPDGQGRHYMATLTFKVTNNETEYEALIVGLSVVARMGIPRADNEAIDKLAQAALGIEEVPLPWQVERRVIEVLVVGMEVGILGSNTPEWASRLMEYLDKGKLPKTREEWGVDLMGPFLPGKGGVKFMIVAVDYFTKWVEVELLATITSRVVTKFLWKNIVCRFGILQRIITDNGCQFDSDHYKEWYAELKIKAKYSSPAHPQANGQAEATNKVLLSILKKKVATKKGDWANELPGYFGRTELQQNLQQENSHLHWRTDARQLLQLK